MRERGGGLAAIFSDTFKCKHLHFGSFSSFKYQVILESQTSVLLITIYRPPKHTASFLPEMSELLSVYFTNDDRILITGDLNLHVDNVSDCKAMEFMQLLHSFDFTQHIVGPTHKCGPALDRVISRGLNIIVDTIVYINISDHYCQFFNMTIVGLAKNDTEPFFKRRFLSPSSAAKFPYHILSLPLSV